jgi:hypothetical protein
MADGENGAKKIVLNDLKELVQKLKDGSAEEKDLYRAMSIMLEVMGNMYAPTLITDGDLERRLEKFRADCPVHQKWVEQQNLKKAMPMLDVFLKALGNSAGALIMIAAYALGLHFGWW